MQRQTHDIGQYFVQFIALQTGSPLAHRAVSNETQYPYRTSRPIVLRLFGLGIVLGHWQPTGRTEEEALAQAVLLPGHKPFIDGAAQAAQIRDAQRD